MFQNTLLFPKSERPNFIFIQSKNENCSFAQFVFIVVVIIIISVKMR
jgi:hypothetical protein